MSGPGIFPKENSQTLFAEDVNLLYGNFIGMRSTEAETAVNVAKLQYCASITDIDHDYMVVDVFIDSNGYNNTLCLANTTSIYCSSALNGYYVNQECCTNVLCQQILTCSRDSVCIAYPSFGNYFICGSPSCFLDIGHCGSSCINNDYVFCLDGIKEFRFNVCARVSVSSSCVSSGGCVYTIGFEDVVCVNNCVGNYTSCNVGCLNCYKYECVCADCWDFYCNGSCVCQVTRSTFPNICLFYCARNYAGTEIRVVNLCICNNYLNNKIATVPIEYSQPAQTSYLSTEKFGTGTIKYNVYDATTDCQIGTNLAPNTLNTLTDCVPCHYYEIIQCSDGVSCIKSYAILAGVY